MEIVVTSPKSCCENSKELMQWAESLAPKMSLKKKKVYSLWSCLCALGLKSCRVSRGIPNNNECFKQLNNLPPPLNDTLQICSVFTLGAELAPAGWRHLSSVWQELGMETNGRFPAHFRDVKMTCYPGHLSTWSFLSISRTPQTWFLGQPDLLVTDGYRLNSGSPLLSVYLRKSISWFACFIQQSAVSFITPP